MERQRRILNRSLIVDPTRIGHLLCLNAKWWIHARVRLDDRTVDGVLQIDESERVIFRRARNINTWLVGEVTESDASFVVQHVSEPLVLLLTDLLFEMCCRHSRASCVFCIEDASAEDRCRLSRRET